LVSTNSQPAKKSHEKEEKPPRRALTVVKEITASSKITKSYKDIGDFLSKIKRLKING